MDNQAHQMEGGVKSESDKIIEAEVIDEELISAKNNRSKILLFLLLGVLIGVALKGRFLADRVMGFEDYKVKQLKSDYSFEAPEPVSSTTPEGGESPVPTQDQPSCN